MAEHPVTRRELDEALDVTKTELKADFKTELKAEMSVIKREILEAVQEMIRDSQTAVTKAISERTQEMIRDSQTEVLKAFFSYQEGADIRMRTTEVKLSNVDTGLSERVAVVERRLRQIEAKLLLNPPPA
jgi:hypothetical protein